MSSQACVVQLLLPQDEYSKGPQPLFVVRNTVQGEEGMTDQDLKNKINEKLHNSHEEAGFQSQCPQLPNLQRLWADLGNCTCNKYRGVRLTLVSCARDCHC